MPVSTIPIWQLMAGGATGEMLPYPQLGGALGIPNTNQIQDMTDMTIIPDRGSPAMPPSPGMNPDGPVAAARSRLISPTSLTPDGFYRHDEAQYRQDVLNRRIREGSTRAAEQQRWAGMGGDPSRFVSSTDKGPDGMSRADEAAYRMAVQARRNGTPSAQLALGAGMPTGGQPSHNTQQLPGGIESMLPDYNAPPPAGMRPQTGAKPLAPDMRHMIDTMTASAKGMSSGQLDQQFRDQTNPMFDADYSNIMENSDSQMRRDLPGFKPGMSATGYAQNYGQGAKMRGTPLVGPGYGADPRLSRTPEEAARNFQGSTPSYSTLKNGQKMVSARASLNSPMLRAMLPQTDQPTQWDQDVAAFHDTNRLANAAMLGGPNGGQRFDMNDPQAAEAYKLELAKRSQKWNQTPEDQRVMLGEQRIKEAAMGLSGNNPVNNMAPEQRLHEARNREEESARIRTLLLAGRLSDRGIDMRIRSGQINEKDVADARAAASERNGGIGQQNLQAMMGNPNIPPQMKMHIAAKAIEHENELRRLQEQGRQGIAVAGANNAALTEREKLKIAAEQDMQQRQMAGRASEGEKERQARMGEKQLEVTGRAETTKIAKDSADEQQLREDARTIVGQDPTLPIDQVMNNLRQQRDAKRGVAPGAPPAAGPGTPPAAGTAPASQPVKIPKMVAMGIPDTVPPETAIQMIQSAYPNYLTDPEQKAAAKDALSIHAGKSGKTPEQYAAELGKYKEPNWYTPPHNRREIFGNAEPREKWEQRMRAENLARIMGGLDPHTGQWTAGSGPFNTFIPLE
jgi:hypothetical protein